MIFTRSPVSDSMMLSAKDGENTRNEEDNRESTGARKEKDDTREVGALPGFYI